MINQNLTSDDILKKYNSILINLNIVASINKNDKLYIHNSELVRHPYSSTRVFTRWWNNYNRKDCIKFINELYEDISSLIIALLSISIKTDATIKKRHHRKIKKKARARKVKLIASCKNTKRGLLHLMITYKDDPDFSDFINKILGIIDKMD